MLVFANFNTAPEDLLATQVLKCHEWKVQLGQRGQLADAKDYIKD